MTAECPPRGGRPKRPQGFVGHVRRTARSAYRCADCGKEIPRGAGHFRRTVQAHKRWLRERVCVACGRRGGAA